MPLSAEETSALENFMVIYTKLCEHPDCIAVTAPYTNQLRRLNETVTNWVYKPVKNRESLRAFKKMCDETLSLPPFSMRKPKKLFEDQDVFSATCDKLVLNFRALRDLSIERDLGKEAIESYVYSSLFWWGFNLGTQLITYLISYLLLGGMVFATLLFPLPLAPLIIPYIMLDLLFSCAAQMYGFYVYDLFKEVVLERDHSILESHREFVQPIPLALLGASFLFGSVFGGLAGILLFGPATPVITIAAFAIGSGLTAVVSTLKNISIGVILAGIIDALKTVINLIEEAIENQKSTQSEVDQAEEIPPQVSTLSFLSHDAADTQNSGTQENIVYNP